MRQPVLALTLASHCKTRTPPATWPTRCMLPSLRQPSRRQGAPPRERCPEFESRAVGILDRFARVTLGRHAWPSYQVFGALGATAGYGIMTLIALATGSGFHTWILLATITIATLIVTLVLARVKLPEPVKGRATTLLAAACASLAEDGTASDYPSCASARD